MIAHFLHISALIDLDPKGPVWYNGNGKLEFDGQMIAQLTVGEATDARAVQAFKKVFFPANSYNLKAFP